MLEFFKSISDFIDETEVIDQIREVAVADLFTNPYFLVPFIIMIGYWIYKKQVNNFAFLGVVGGIWLFSGSPYAQNLIVNGELQLGKVLPVAAVGILAICIIIYVVFIRSD